MEKELASVHNALVESVARVQNSMSPIAMLPTEILLKIFTYIAGPQTADPDPAIIFRVPALAR